MIRHIVVFKVTGDTADSRTVSFETLVGALRPLADSVPSLRSLRVDADTSGIEGHWDAALVSEHDSWEDLAAYQTHPQHVAAVGLIATAVADRAVVDIEM